MLQQGSCAVTATSAGDWQQLAATSCPPPQSTSMVDYCVGVQNGGLARVDGRWFFGEALASVETGVLMEIHGNIAVGFPLERIHAESGSHLFVRKVRGSFKDWVPVQLMSRTSCNIGQE